MKYIFYLIALLPAALCMPLFTAAQSAIQIPDNIFKLAPLSLIDITGMGIQLGYERRLGTHTSITGEFAIPTLTSAYDRLSNQQVDVSLRNDIKLRAEGRYYFVRAKKQSAWFLALEGGYRFQSMMQYPGYYKKMPTDRPIIEVRYSSAHVTKTVYGVGYSVGNRALLSKSVYLEFQVGIGYRMFFTTHGDMKDVRVEERGPYAFEGRGSAAFTDGAMGRVYIPMGLKLAVDLGAANHRKKMDNN
jgi:hypothetical protein